MNVFLNSCRSKIQLNFFNVIAVPSHSLFLSFLISLFSILVPSAFHFLPFAFCGWLASSTPHCPSGCKVDKTTWSNLTSLLDDLGQAMYLSGNPHL